MKNSKITLASTLATVSFYTSEAMAQYKLPEPGQDSLFGTDTKAYQLSAFVYWGVLGFAGIAAISFFIMSGSYATRGDWSKSAASFVGACISGIGAWLVANAQAT
jgi:hypothetical protein